MGVVGVGGKEQMVVGSSTEVAGNCLCNEGEGEDIGWRCKVDVMDVSSSQQVVGGGSRGRNKVRPKDGTVAVDLGKTVICAFCSASRGKQYHWRVCHSETPLCSGLRNHRQGRLELGSFCRQALEVGESSSHQ